jgi:phospholipase C
MAYGLLLGSVLVSSAPPSRAAEKLDWINHLVVIYQENWSFDSLYDTTSILKTIEVRWNLQPLGTRDAAANALGNAFR